MTDKPLGMRWEPAAAPGVAVMEPLQSGVNTRVALWPQRWPAIALQECIDTVEAAPPELQSQVKFDLPCKTCAEKEGCLNAKRKELGPLMYDREILTSPRSSESSLFPLEMFKPMLMRDQNCVPYWHKPFSVESEYAVVQAWDLAWSEKIGGDWLVCMTAYVHRVTGRRHLLDVQRWQRLTFPAQCALIEARWEAYKSDLVVIEGDAAQQIWRQHMTATTSVPVLSHSSGSKGDLAAGVPGLLILLENRKWEFPYAQGYHREEIDTWLSEMEAFGWVDGKLQGVGEHDDTVMCFWHLNWGIDKYLAMGTGEQYRGMQDGAQI
jgi:hypothetical protein